VSGRTWVVVGLGNPGPRYERTRHNIGFELVDRLAADLGARPAAADPAYRAAWAELAGDRVALLKPLTYMNRSGDAVRRFPASEEAGPGRHLVVLDDAALPFGAIRFRERGSAGGHRGLASILEALGTEEVPRLRMGIGEGDGEEDLVEHVLDRFSEEEEREIGSWLERAGAGVRVFLTEGAGPAMSRFNG
jgi:PTH1 family peptidyl-tRNA hydrolase